MAVALVVCVAFILVWRTRGAIREAEGGGDEHDDGSASITVELLQPSPVEYRAPDVFGFSSVPPVPHLRIATIRVVGPTRELQHKLANPKDHYESVHHKMVELNANAYVHERVDDQAPGLGFDEAELIEAVYLVHAGRVQEPLRRELQNRACLLTEVTPGSAAEEAGLQVGDLVIDVDGTRFVEEGLRENDACRPIQRALREPNKVRLGILRSGELLQVEMARRGAKFGIFYRDVPILPDA